MPAAPHLATFMHAPVRGGGYAESQFLLQQAYTWYMAHGVCVCLGVLCVCVCMCVCVYICVCVFILLQQVHVYV